MAIYPATTLWLFCGSSSQVFSKSVMCQGLELTHIYHVISVILVRHTGFGEFEFSMGSLTSDRQALAGIAHTAPQCQSH